MTVIAPWMSPAAPVPAMALPRIKIAELGAAAHKAEPAMEDLVADAVGYAHPQGAIRRKSRQISKNNSSIPSKINMKSKVYQFDIKELIKRGAGWLKCGYGDEICRAIPANITKGMELC